MRNKADPRSTGPRPPIARKAERPRGWFRPLAPLARLKGKSSDVVVAALGISLGLVCALFPWYIFLNQDKFGVQAMRFQGQGYVRSGGQGVNAPSAQPGVALDEMPSMQVDFLATGTPRTTPPGDRELRAAKTQPFPAEPPDFSLVHVANGRAMIRDADGLWVVQAGSRLPDGSHAKLIERRDGRWVLVTSRDHVVALEN